MSLVTCTDTTTTTITVTMSNSQKDYVLLLLVSGICFLMGISLATRKHKLDFRDMLPKSELAQHVSEAYNVGYEAGRADHRVPKDEPESLTHETVLKLLWLAETDGRLRPPDGDDGNSIGPFQITYDYWQDASRHQDMSVFPSYEDCRDYTAASQVVTAYMRRWVPDAWKRCDLETIARTHNGGPQGAAKTATTPFWTRVQFYREVL
jgi:hypothetical protein